MRSDLLDPNGGTLPPLSVLVFLPRPLRPFGARAEAAARAAPLPCAEAAGARAGAAWRLSGTAGGGAPGPEEPPEEGLEDEEAFEGEESEDDESAEEDASEDADGEEEEESEEDADPEGEDPPEDPIP